MICFHKIKNWLVTHKDGREVELKALTAYFARERGSVLLGCDRDDIIQIKELEIPK